jgi:hypothetical protein
MFDFIDLYVVGFSFLSFYVLKTYSQARVVWKQFGSVLSYLLHNAGLIMLFFSLSTIPGRRTLFTEFSVFANFSKDVKYIAPGLYKGWTEKHDGIILFFNRVINAHGGIACRAQEIWLGCHKQRTSHHPSHFLNVPPITACRLPCGQRLEEVS